MKSIRQLRRERNWTQFELALAVGVQPQTVYLWESGRRIPQVPQLRRLGQVFGICSDEIMLGPLDDATAALKSKTHSPRRLREPTLDQDAEARGVTRGGDVASIGTGH